MSDAHALEDDRESDNRLINESEASLMRKRIITALLIYPRVSPSMLQSAIGPHNPPSKWRPILEEMIREGIIKRLQQSHLSERGRWRTIIILHLSKEALEISNNGEYEDEEDLG